MLLVIAAEAAELSAYSLWFLAFAQSRSLTMRAASGVEALQGPGVLGDKGERRALRDICWHLCTFLNPLKSKALTRILW